MASNSNTLYITYVDIHQNLLKIWGQKNKIGASYIQRQLLQLAPELNVMKCPNPLLLDKGTLCYVKCSESEFYRARVVSSGHGESVGVIFVDSGNMDIVHISNVKVPDRNDDVLLKMAEQAEEFYLAGVAAPESGWTKEVLAEVRRDLCYQEVLYAETHQVANKKLIKIQSHNGDYSSYLINKQFAQHIPLNGQSQLILTYCEFALNNMRQDGSKFQNMSNSGRPIVLRPVQQQFTSNKPVDMQQYTNNNQSYSPYGHTVDQMSHPMQTVNETSPVDYMYNQMSQDSGMPRGPGRVLRPSYSPVMYNAVPPVKEKAKNMNSYNNVRMPSMGHFNSVQYKMDNNSKSVSFEENEPHTYINSVLEVGSTHKVCVTFIDDGPWSFSIQLTSSKDDLCKLREELLHCDLTPIKTPVILGQPCVCASHKYGTLCRGVIVSLSHNGVKVYFVDNGDTEDLSVTAIFELPQKFFKTRVFSQKFCLTGLQKVPYSEEIKMHFTKVVENKLLLLRVCSLEDDYLPTCDLYLNDKNVKQIINDRVQSSKTTSDVNPDVGDTENVVVTWVESLRRFFVQLCKRDPQLNALKQELSHTDSIGQTLNYHELSIGLKCVCKYDLDGQWYRAMVMSFLSESNITVFYFDYGNTETVDISHLRKVQSSGMINTLSNQALLCSLHGYESRPDNQELTNKFENITLEKDLTMVVMGIVKGHLSVKLYENNQNISDLLLPVHVENPNLKVDHRTIESDVGGHWKNGDAFQRKQVGGRSGPPGQGSYEKSDPSNMFMYNSDRPRPMSLAQNGINVIRHLLSAEKDRQNSSIGPETKDWNEESNWREENRKRDRGQMGPNNNSSRNEKVGKGFRPGMESQPDQRGRFDSGFDPGAGRRGKGPGPDPSERGAGDFFQKKSPSGPRAITAGAGPGAPFAAKGGGGGDKPKKPRFQALRKDEVAAEGSTFEEGVVEVGGTERAIITYYANPHDFYVQLLTNEDEFRTMMQEMQLYYSDKYNERRPFKSGDIVIARYSYDNLLYRGEVVKSEPLTVRYVDYGNEEELGPMRTWQVTKQFLKLPKQVLRCRLANVQPIGSDWQASNTTLDSLFEAEEYECTFVGCENNIYDVTLKVMETGKNVAAEMVEAGLGVPGSRKLEIPKIDFSLLPRQTLRLHVSHVESPSRFYVAVNSKATEAVDSVLKALAVNAGVLRPLDETSLTPDTVCVVTLDESKWFRGTLVNVSETNVEVKLSDRGDTVEVPMDKVKSASCLSDHLRTLEPQAVECCLHGDADSVSPEEFKNAVQGNHCLLHVVSETDKRLSVLVYDQNGKLWYGQRDDDCPETVDRVGQMPLLSQNLPVFASHVESVGEMYIQLKADAEDLDNLSDQLSEFYGDAGVRSGDFAGAAGDLVAAKSDVYGTWYRARVADVTTDSVTVFYVDFGGEEKVPRENVTSLDESFCRLNCFARRVGLDAVECGSEQTDKLKALTQERELSGYFINERGSFVAEFVADGKRITPQVTDSSASPASVDKFENLIVTDCSLQTTAVAMDPSHSANVFVIHIDSPKSFWVHRETSMNDVEDFQQRLQKACETLPNADDPDVDDVVAAVFDNVWYRAKVLTRRSDNLLKVKFIDYGNLIEVDLSRDSVKPLSDEFTGPPTFASQFSLDGRWKDAATGKFQELIMECEDPVTLVPLKEGNPPVVDLRKDGQSIYDILVRQGVAEDDGTSVGNDHNQLSTVYITHSNSPDDFYVQRESVTESLADIASALSNSDALASVVSPEVGDVYAAKFPEDDVWYRGRVLSTTGDGSTEVMFIDYGNASATSELKHLPEDLVTLPAMCENYALARSESHAWSRLACDRFASYVTDARPLRMKVIGHGDGTRPTVSLSADGRDIAEELESLNRHDVGGDEQEGGGGDDSDDGGDDDDDNNPGDGPREVLVCHVNSPVDFYIRNVRDEEYDRIRASLEMADDEEDLDDRRPGVTCLARSTEDSAWARGQILRHADDAFEVSLIDHGKTIVTAELKKATGELSSLPARATRCCLDLPETNITESVKEDFVRLLSDGNPVIRATVVTPGDVNVVSLTLNGRPLEDELRANDVTTDMESRETGVEYSGPLDEETDDEKTSKKSQLPGDYLCEFSDDARATGYSPQNETDEEKQIKSGSEGFKSDDEKGMVNATDSELQDSYEGRPDTLNDSSADDDSKLTETSVQQGSVVVGTDSEESPRRQNEQGDDGATTAEEPAEEEGQADVAEGETAPADEDSGVGEPASSPEAPKTQENLRDGDEESEAENSLEQVSGTAQPVTSTGETGVGDSSKDAVES